MFFIKLLCNVFLFLFCINAQASYEFKFFNSHEEAQTVLQEALDLLNIDFGTFNPPSKRLEEIKSITSIVLNEMRFMNPHLPIPDQDPYILFLDTDIPIAFALNDNEEGETPYLYVLSNVFLNESYESLAGLIAHELCHLILQWIDEKGVFHPTEYFFFHDSNHSASSIANSFLTQKIRDYVSLKGEKALTSFNGIEKIRFENREDHADQQAVLILHRLELSIEGYNSLLMKHFLEETETCNTRTEPNYGEITDPHHATCWRVWRNRSLDLQLYDIKSK